MNALRLKGAVHTFVDDGKHLGPQQALTYVAVVAELLMAQRAGLTDYAEHLYRTLQMILWEARYKGAR